MPRANFRSAMLGVLSAVLIVSARGADVDLTFDDAVIGKPVPAYTNNGVVFTPAHGATQSRATPRIMFFPHLDTDHKGILNAMATDPIPVKATFPNGASSVTLILWGSTGCAALVEACDKEGKVVDKASLAAVPARTSPADPIPTCELTVKAPEIAFIRFSGPRSGEYLAAQEIRFTPWTGPTIPTPPQSGQTKINSANNTEPISHLPQLGSKSWTDA